MSPETFYCPVFLLEYLNSSAFFAFLYLMQSVEVHHGGVSLDRYHLYPRTHDLVYLRVLEKTFNQKHVRGMTGWGQV